LRRSMNTLKPFNKPPPAWGRVPLFGVAVAVILGVLVADWSEYAGQNYWWWSMIALLFLSGVMLGFISARRWYPVAHSAVLVLAIFFLAGWRSADTYLPNKEAFFAHTRTDGVSYAGVVDAVRPGERNLRLAVTLKMLITEAGSPAPTLGRVLLYVPPDERGAGIKTGDGIVFRAKPTLLRAPLNPGVFDLRNYWKRQHVYHQVFLRDPHQYQIIPSAEPGWQQRFAAWREAWFNTFRLHLKGDELAVATALVLGKRDLLTTEIRSAYADTGAMHVLAVSGLHVGIVYLILLSLLGWLRRWPWGRWVLAALSLVGIWAFAAVTGWSPSVQRAAIMFSAIVVGGLGRRRIAVFNSLALAAIVMLLVDPQQLFAVGFQLSFSALTGIVFFTPSLEKLFYFPLVVLRKGWSAVAASIGAQLGTLPLALHYFQQFPLYFMLSGTVVVITAYFALIFGVLHGFTAGILGWNFGAGITGWFLGLVVSVQNTCVFYFRKLPFARLEWAEFGWFPAMLLALGILGLAAWVRWRKRSHLMLAILLPGLAFFWARTQVQSHRVKSRAIVYHQSRQTLIDVFTPAKSVTLGQVPDPADLAWSAGPSRRRFGVDTLPNLPLTTRDTVMAGVSLGAGGAVTLLGHEILLMDGSTDLVNPVKAPEYVLVLNDYNPRKCPRLEGPVTLIVDGSNPPWRGTAWRQLGRERGWTVHLTWEDGAFIFEEKTEE
jgi:competence protein ComEC